MKKTLLFLSLFICSLVATAQLNMTLKSNFAYGVTLANLWGWADGLGREYALVGEQTGLSIVDVTNPFAPVEVQFVPTQLSNWHEIKTWQHYAYVVNESGGGTLIVDLSGLPGSVTYVYDTQATLNSTNYTITDAHSVSIDENGYMWLNGGQANIGAWCFNLNINPMNPQLVAHYSAYGPNYMHDCYVRNNIMYTADIYAGKTRILDVTNKSSPVQLANKTTPWNFTHNTWLSDNSSVLFTTDEVSGAYVTAYDISNLASITELDRFTGNPGTNSVPHNVHVKNDYLVIAHYRDGVVIADANRPTNIVKVGNFDTYLQGSGSGFNGCWGVYPYLPSGNILASDISNGLFVLGVNYIRASYLEGTVTDSTTGLPLSGVAVNIVSAPGAQSTVTSASGAYATGSAAAGTYSVQFSKAGYNSRTLNATLTSSNVTVLNTVLGMVPTLPIELLSFTVAATNDNNVMLSWSTDSELNNDYFTVERARDGIAFEEILRKKGAGNSTVTLAYSALDEHPHHGTSYYRLKQTDYDGRFTYSNIVAVTINESELTVDVFPNPFESETQFYLLLENNSTVNVDLLDLNGKLVRHLFEQEMQKGNNTVQVETENISPGVYIVRTIVGDKNYYTKLAKQ